MNFVSYIAARRNFHQNQEEIKIVLSQYGKSMYTLSHQFGKQCCSLLVKINSINIVLYLSFIHIYIYEMYFRKHFYARLKTARKVTLLQHQI